MVMKVFSADLLNSMDPKGFSTAVNNGKKATKKILYSFNKDGRRYNVELPASDFFQRLEKGQVNDKVPKVKYGKSEQTGSKLQLDTDDKGHFETVPWKDDYPDNIMPSGAGYDVHWVSDNKTYKTLIPGSGD